MMTARIPPPGRKCSVACNNLWKVLSTHTATNQVCMQTCIKLLRTGPGHIGHAILPSLTVHSCAHTVFPCSMRIVIGFKEIRHAVMTSRVFLLFPGNSIWALSIFDTPPLAPVLVHPNGIFKEFCRTRGPCPLQSPHLNCGRRPGQLVQEWLCLCVQSPNDLLFLTRLFPCAKTIVNIRLDAHAQAKVCSQTRDHATDNDTESAVTLGQAIHTYILAYAQTHVSSATQTDAHYVHAMQATHDRHDAFAQHPAPSVTSHHNPPVHVAAELGVKIQGCPRLARGVCACVRARCVWCRNL